MGGEFGGEEGGKCNVFSRVFRHGKKQKVFVVSLSVAERDDSLTHTPKREKKERNKNYFLEIRNNSFIFRNRRCCCFVVIAIMCFHSSLSAKPPQRERKGKEGADMATSQEKIWEFFLCGEARFFLLRPYAGNDA